MLLEKVSSCGRRRSPSRIGSISTQPCITGTTIAGQRFCMRPPPLVPQFGSRQRRIDRDDRRADGQAHGAIQRRQRHRRRRSRRSRRTPAPADWACGRGTRARIPDHAAGDEADRIQRQQQRARRASRRRWSRSRPRPRRADRRCPTISTPGYSPACRRTSAWPRACLRPWWRTDIAWRYRTTWVHPNACDAVFGALRKCNLRAISIADTRSAVFEIRLHADASFHENPCNSSLNWKAKRAPIGALFFVR